jgi:hypothetical protein
VGGEYTDLVSHLTLSSFPVLGKGDC